VLHKSDESRHPCIIPDLSLFKHDMKLYIENPKDSTKKVPKLINDFSNVTRYKINIQKSVASLYPNSEVPEKKLRK